MVAGMHLCWYSVAKQLRAYGNDPQRDTCGHQGTHWWVSWGPFGSICQIREPAKASFFQLIGAEDSETILAALFWFTLALHSRHYVITPVPCFKILKAPAGSTRLGTSGFSSYWPWSWTSKYALSCIRPSNITHSDSQGPVQNLRHTKVFLRFANRDP